MIVSRIQYKKLLQKAASRLMQTENKLAGMMQLTTTGWRFLCKQSSSYHILKIG
jgi:hypothetical protein